MSFFLNFLENMLEWGKGNRSVRKSFRRSEPLVRWCKSWQDNGKCLAKENSCNWCCAQWVTGCKDVRFGKSSGLCILPRNTHCKSIRRCYGFLSDYLSFVSHMRIKYLRDGILCVALFFYSSWVGWCYRLYCLRGSEWFAKRFSLYSYYQVLMLNLFAKVLPYFYYCCCKGINILRYVLPQSLYSFDTSDLGNRESHAIYVEPSKSGVGNYRRIYR